jgi:hypothetical protein
MPTRLLWRDPAYWRDWTDEQDKRREAVTFRAHQLFESARPRPNHDDQGGEHDSRPATAEPGEAIAPGAESVSGEDLPF